MKKGGDERVKVAVRCRPISEKEKLESKNVIVSVTPARGEIVLNPREAGEEPRTFTFDLTYGMDSLQENVYKDTGYPIIESVLQGYNGTVFAYGQTGTGKTFTMEGKLDPPNLRGIIPRSFDHIFKIINATPTKQFLVRASFLELHNEEIRDLLNKNMNNKMELREKPEGGFYVKELSSFMIQSVKELLEKLEQGRQSRHVAETNMNKESSRSHCIFSVTVEASEIKSDGNQHITMGKLNLVDLAGSERQSKTGLTGENAREGIYINQSLTSLGNVISALVDPKSTHIPYRDSKLTKLLQDSLGGNTKTVMIANIGPVDWNYEETLSTLRYANRAKNIKNKPKINEDPKDAMLRQFQEEIQRLKAQLAQIGGGALPNAAVVQNGEEIVVEKIVKIEDEERIRKMQEELDKEKGDLLKWADDERKKIEAQKNLAEDEKLRLLKELKEKEETERKAMEDQGNILKKLKKMEDKLLQGNKAMEKALAKEKELERARLELEERKNQERRDREEIQRLEELQLMKQDKFSSLQEEIEDKNKKLKRLFTKVQTMKDDLRDEQESWAREKEIVISELREYSRELKLKMLMIDHFIPVNILQTIEDKAVYHQEIDDWYFPNMNLCGNVLQDRKGDDTDAEARAAADQEEKTAVLNFESHPNVYFVYTEEGPVREEMQAPKEKKTRVKTAKKPGSAKNKRQKDEALYPKAKGLVGKKSNAA